ncbi:MAG: hypothetical protein PHP69_00160 [Candidatus Omnitrophica bacterium]|nr:hypothetical protein [Candidatus Omnitrophota bacterium]MDD5080781.1 hypothetical protein [Candidatus Omnitrophota bacterium]
MKQYRKPKVTEIELDISQAILAACMVAPGAWFYLLPSVCYAFTAVGTGTVWGCRTSPVGRTGGAGASQIGANQDKPS